MNIFVTSDHHFGHAAVIQYSKRPFKSVQEMDREMIRRWNEVVLKDDLVYHLGDFSFRKDLPSLFSQLNGKISWLSGNHDKKKYKDSSLTSTVRLVGPYEELKLNGHTLILCHYPFYKWNKCHYGSLHLHGHSHGGLDIENESILRYDVGVDANQHNFYPQKIEDVIDRLTKREAYTKFLEYDSSPARAKMYETEDM